MKVDEVSRITCPMLCLVNTGEVAERIRQTLNRCQSYGQCVFAAPTVFRLHCEESFEYDYEPDEALRVQVERGTLSSKGVPPLVIWGKQAKRLPNEQNGTRRTRKEK